MPPPPPLQIENWQLAEQNAAAWMRWWGYSDAEVTNGGSDGGVDVQAKRALGQVKFQAVQVGRQELQRLFGARGHDLHQVLFFFTGAGYSAPAVAYADKANVALFQYSLTGAMTPMNSSARLVLRAVEERESTAQRARDEVAERRRAEAIRATREAAREAALREEARQASIRVKAKRAVAEEEARRAAAREAERKVAEREAARRQSPRIAPARPRPPFAGKSTAGPDALQTVAKKRTKDDWNPAPHGKRTPQLRPTAREPERRHVGHWAGLFVLTVILALPSAIDTGRGGTEPGSAQTLIVFGAVAALLLVGWISAVRHNKRLYRSE